MKKEVLHRLLLAKSILATARFSVSGPHGYLVSKFVLNAHDAADLVFAAIADYQSKIPPGKSTSMMQCLELIDSPIDKHAGYFNQLNDARNSLKHRGNLPNASQWATVGEDVFEKLSDLCQATLNISLNDADESELLNNKKAKTHVAAAKAAASSLNFKLALEELGKALFVTLDEAPSGIGWGVTVGRPKAEDALKLSGYGVSANEFLRFQEFLPMVSGFSDAPEVLWKQSGFGHPGNWNAEVMEFCLNTYFQLALSIQSAASLPYAMEFSDVYEYQVTSKIDRAEVWKDFLHCPVNHFRGDQSRQFRQTLRFLGKGEFVTVSAVSRESFLSDDLSVNGEPITRVRLTYDRTTMFFPAAFVRDHHEEFLNLADVEITCVPRSLVKRINPDLAATLPELPWERDPLAFSV